MNVAEDAFIAAKREWYDKIVKDAAEQMRKKMSGYTLYGFEVDVTDPEQVIAAAYYALEQARFR